MTVPPSSHPLGAIEPGPECALCLRLQAFRQVNRGDHPDWHNAPVPSFGVEDAALLIVGLAPGLRGANKTGRPFTGDLAGDLLYSCLAKFGFSDGDYDARPDDGLRLLNCRITNAVRCVPPENKPIGAEAKACRQFLASEIAAMPMPHHIRERRGSRRVLRNTLFSIGISIAVVGEEHLLQVRLLADHLGYLKLCHGLDEGVRVSQDGAAQHAVLNRQVLHA